MLSKIKKTSLSSQLLDAITELIENGSWKPGEKLPNEIDLAASFSVSRNIMREAMKTLVSFGMLESKAGSGTFVSKDAMNNIHNMRFFNELKNNSSIEKIMETRLIIEPELAYYACIRCTESDVLKLGSDLETANQKHEAMNFFHTDDFDFHIQLARLSQNEILSNLLETLLNQLKNENYVQFNQYVSQEVKQKSINDHQRIFEALEKRDPLLTRSIMHDHLFSRINVINSSYNADLAASRKIASRRKNSSQ